MALTTAIKAEVIQTYQRAPKDTGSPEVQIALITSRINDLSRHLTEHAKDVHSRRGLMKLVALRRKLLDYLKSVKPQSYKEILGRLGLRR